MALSVPVLISAEEWRGICETRPWKKTLVCRVPCSKVHPSFASLRFAHWPSFLSVIDCDYIRRLGFMCCSECSLAAIRRAAISKALEAEELKKTTRNNKENNFRKAQKKGSQSRSRKTELE